MPTCPCCGEEFESTPDPNEEFCSNCILNVRAERLAEYSKQIEWGDDCPDCDNPMVVKETADGDEYQYCPHCKHIY